MRIGLAVAVVFVLGCSGMMGYGEEISKTSISSGAPFTASVVTIADQPHQLWLNYDLTSAGDFEVDGSLEAKVGGKSIGQWTLQHRPGQPPIVGETSEFSLNTYQLGDRNSGTVWMTELPAQPAGTTVEITGTWTAAPNTQVSILELIVTD